MASLRPLCGTLALDKAVACHMTCQPCKKSMHLRSLGGSETCMDRKHLSCHLCFSSALMHRGSLQGGSKARLALRKQVEETGPQDLSLWAKHRTIQCSQEENGYRRITGKAYLKIQIPRTAVYHFRKQFINFWKSSTYTYHKIQPYHPRYLPKKKGNIYPKKDLYVVFPAVLFSMAKTTGNNPNVETCEWISQLWYIHTLEYYSAMKRNKLLIHSNMHESENTYAELFSQTRKSTYCMISLIEMSRKCPLIHSDRKSGCLGLGLWQGGMRRWDYKGASANLWVMTCSLSSLW